jgi:hypothetical protein
VLAAIVRHRKVASIVGGNQTYRLGPIDLTGIQAPNWLGTSGERINEMDRSVIKQSDPAVPDARSREYRCRQNQSRLHGDHTLLPLRNEDLRLTKIAPISGLACMCLLEALVTSRF